MNPKVSAAESLKSDRIYRMNKITRDSIAVLHFSNLSWCRLNLVNLVNPVKDLNPVIRRSNDQLQTTLVRRRCLAAS